MTFVLSKAVNPAKVFIDHKSNVTARWDPFYFRPELVAFEKRIREITPHRLRDFVLSMAGGATPSTNEAQTHYTESEDGVLFIRVQNLSTTGRLNLDDCKRITRSTHEGLLKRSKLSGGELLVKITGVGRMAVASVVPECFEGNINQHVAAIRTTDFKTSNTLAAYLNLDVAERLASRRSTGGTRPALDYRALLSIPVVFHERLPSLMRTAVDRYHKQLNKAITLLATIEDMMLDELGIANKPEPVDTIERRIFRRDFSDVSGKRIDPASNWRKLSLTGGKFPIRKLRDVVAINPATRFPPLQPDTPVSFVPMDTVSDVFGEIADRQTRRVSEAGSYTRFQEHDVIWAKITPCMENGKSAVADGLVEGVGYGSTELHVFRRITDELSHVFLHHLLRLKTLRQHARLYFTGASGHQRVDEQFFHKMQIPFPPLKVQKRIADKAEVIKTRSRRLLADAHGRLEKAKRDIEALILGCGSSA